MDGETIGSEVARAAKLCAGRALEQLDTWSPKVVEPDFGTVGGCSWMLGDSECTLVVELRLNRMWRATVSGPLGDVRLIHGVAPHLLADSLVATSGEFVGSWF